MGSVRRHGSIVPAGKGRKREKVGILDQGCGGSALLRDGGVGMSLRWVWMRGGKRGFFGMWEGLRASLQGCGKSSGNSELELMEVEMLDPRWSGMGSFQSSQGWSSGKHRQEVWSSPQPLEFGDGADGAEFPRELGISAVLLPGKGQFHDDLKPGFACSAFPNSPPAQVL